MADEQVSAVDVSQYLSVTDRYYTRKYKIDLKGKQCEDQCVLFHSNRICVVGVASSHPMVSEKKEIKEVNFQVTEKVNRLNNKVSGKGKKGAQWLNEDSPLCNILCSDGSQYTLYSCIRGKLVEVNERLMTNPQLIINKPQAEGYIAIVLPKLGESEQQQAQLLSSDSFRDILNNRMIKSTEVKVEL